MRASIRPLTVAVSLICMVALIPIAIGSRALAQTSQQMTKQMTLTEKQIEGVLAAEPEMDKLTEKLPDNVRPDSKIVAQLEELAKQNGFASYDEYTNVMNNIGLVLGGFDPVTKKYVGPEAVIKAEIAQVQSNKNMSAIQKKDALADLNQALKSLPPAVENKGNIDLVAKYYDKLAAMLGEDDEEE